MRRNPFVAGFLSLDPWTWADLRAPETTVQQRTRERCDWDNLHSGNTTLFHPTPS